MGNPDVHRRPRCRHGAGSIRVPWALSVSWRAYLPEGHDRLVRIQGGKPAVIGMVLAAGTGRRLRPDTDGLPKALLPVAAGVTILDIALRNLAATGLTDIVVVVGHAAEAIADAAARLERAYGVTL